MNSEKSNNIMIFNKKKENESQIINNSKMFPGIKIFTNIDDSLRDDWKRLYLAGANYNLSPEWCDLWVKWFLTREKKLYIITFWKNNELQLLAPFYIALSDFHLRYRYSN